MKTITLTNTEYSDLVHGMGSPGFCTSCGMLDGHAGCEPDAEGYECPECDERTLMGLEQAMLLGLVRIDVDETDSPDLSSIADVADRQWRIHVCATHIWCKSCSRTLDVDTRPGFIVRGTVNGDKVIMSLVVCQTCLDDVDMDAALQRVEHVHFMKHPDRVNGRISHGWGRQTQIPGTEIHPERVDTVALEVL